MIVIRTASIIVIALTPARRLGDGKLVRDTAFGNRSDRAIAKKLNVLGWPAMYAIDHEGVIRHKSRIAVEFDKAAPIIESLVQKVESRSKQK